MTVLNDMDRFHLAMDSLDRLPRFASAGDRLKQHCLEKLGAHKRYININGEDMPEIRDWRWTAQAPSPEPARPREGLPWSLGPRYILRGAGEWAGSGGREDATPAAQRTALNRTRRRICG